MNGFLNRSKYSSMPTIPCDQLQQLSVSMLEAGGATSDEARIVGHSLVLANACGYASHGVMRLPFYLDIVSPYPSRILGWMNTSWNGI